ncbi:MAG TPA: S9 family peptidase [Acidobacteriota bacterium]|nr:S9 family peptidase [Acidobacteriota bacterium]
MNRTSDRKTRWLAVGAVIVLVGMAAAHAAAVVPPLIPKDLLFGNPERAQARLSPDGTRMSYLAPNEEDVLNVWVGTIGQNDDRMITADTLRGIRIHFWAEDNKHILYMQDKGGDENWRIYAVNLDNGSIRDLTPFDSVQASPVALDPNHPNELLAQMNKRDMRLMDLYNINLTTGDMTLVGENPGNIVGWVPDNKFKVRAAWAATQDGGFELLVRPTEADEFHSLVAWGPDEDSQPYGFTPDGTSMYIGDSRDFNVTRLKTINVSTGEEAVVIYDEKVDLGSVMIHPTEYHVQAVSFNYDRERWKILDQSIAADIEAIRNTFDGEFSIVSRDHADKTWLVAFSSDVKPTRYFAYDRDTKEAEFLFTARPKLDEYTLAPMTFAEIPTRDGLTLPSYLTLPPGAEPKNLPMVLNVHGGPWARDAWGYNPEAQWMANRGWAVLQVNFRGSTGFGKEFVNAGNKEWGRRMQDDLTDAVQWAIDQGYADPTKVAIYGGSYGGYACLAGAAFTPDVYCCGVDIVGPSNLLTLIASIPPYWEPLLKMFNYRLGDPIADEEMLKERSPLFSADKIRIPLLIGQGANDPRVKQAEAEQIVAALKANEQYVEYVVYPDEGHGFARPENRLDFYGRSENFLQKYLGGRVEK